MDEVLDMTGEAAPTSSARTVTPWYSVLIVLTWMVPVALSMVAAAPGAISAATLFAAALSMATIAARPAALLVALPFFALLSPAAGFMSVGGAHLLPSDLLFVGLVAQLGVLAVTNRLKLRSTLHGTLFFILASLYCLSAISGLLAGTLLSLKPILYLSQFVILYIYTTRYATTEAEWGRVINAWLIATVLGALLLIRAYSNGIMLNDFDRALDTPGLDIGSLHYLFQATYYYTGFHYAIGIAIVMAILKLFLANAKRDKALAMISLPILLVALVMMTNKTAMFSALAAVFGVFLILLTRLPVKRAIAIILVAASVVAITIIGISGAFLHSVSDTQRELWTVRLAGTSSLVARTVVYVQAFAAWFTHPLQLVIGMGPDFLDNSGQPTIALAFKQSSVIGYAEGTVDSGWISYLIELGVAGFTVLVLTFLVSIRRMLRYIRTLPLSDLTGRPSLYVLGAMIYTVIALLTQMLGYAKLSWLPFQILIIGLMHGRALTARQLPVPAAVNDAPISTHGTVTL